MEKVLRKFGKGSRTPGSADNVTMEDGGLSVDGWGAYLDDGTGKFLRSNTVPPDTSRNQVLSTKPLSSPIVTLLWIILRATSLWPCARLRKRVAMTRAARPLDLGVAARPRRPPNAPRRSASSVALECGILRKLWSLLLPLIPPSIPGVGQGGPVPPPRTNGHPSYATSLDNDHQASLSRRILRSISHSLKRRCSSGLPVIVL